MSSSIGHGFPRKNTDFFGVIREIRVHPCPKLGDFCGITNKNLGDIAAVRDTLTELLRHLRRFAFKQRRVKHPHVESRLALLAAALDVPEITEGAEELYFLP